VSDVVLAYLWDMDTDVLIEGGARGVDLLARQVALDNGFDVVEVPANWKRDGKAAGFIRNAKMLTEYAPDKVVAIWDGESRGTLDTYQRAIAAGIPAILKEVF
jgi:hypothetical protein